MLGAQIDQVRHFNRYYTRQIGVLEEGLVKSRFSLTEARILYELAHHPASTASSIAEALGLDPGYLSRLLKSFRKDALVESTRCPEDGRQTRLTLSASGQEAFEMLNARSQSAVAELLESLKPADRKRLVSSMGTIEEILNGESRSELCVLREPLPGDFGWIVARHGELYGAEYRWGNKFEGLVARLVAEFVENSDEPRQRCWIAELDGEKVGSAMLTADSEKVARLRLLLVEPKARGKGLGKSLVRQCIDSAKGMGFDELVLWTQSVLVAARAIYENFGFHLEKVEKHHLFGLELEGETWRLKLK